MHPAEAILRRLLLQDVLRLVGDCLQDDTGDWPMELSEGEAHYVQGLIDAGLS